MAAPDLEITNPYATRTLVLATTVKTIRIDPAVYGQMSGLRLYCASAGGYQIDAQGGEPGSSTAPTTDYMVIASAQYVPVETGIHSPSADGYVWISVWADTGTPTLHIQPVPVGR